MEVIENKINNNKIVFTKGQDKCVDPKSFNGQYLVLAGPGTGKTFTIVQRIKAMVNFGIDPNKILCLTFTDTAAGEMKQRIDNELNSDTPIFISTYHSFCKAIIDDNNDDFNYDDSIKIISEAVRTEFLKECVDEIDPQSYREDTKNPYFCIKSIKGTIDEVKHQRLNALNQNDKETFFNNLEFHRDWTPKLTKLENELIEKQEKGKTDTKTLEGRIKDFKKKINKMKEFWTIFELYQKKMDEYNYIDFNDMINMVLDKFDNDPVFLERIASQYDYIIVDEYQDTNALQNKIVEKLAYLDDEDPEKSQQKRKNLFVVGDDNQIIYTFQGAKLDTVEKFIRKIPKNNVICLTESKRSTENILHVARALIKSDPNSLEDNAYFVDYKIDKELTTENGIGDEVQLIEYIDCDDEKINIVNRIYELINSEKCPHDEFGNKKLSEIAILTRGNAELLEYAQLLKNLGIPSELKEGKNIFEIKSSLALYYYLSALVYPERYSDRLYKLMLLPPFKIDPKDFETIQISKSKYRSFYECLQNLKNEPMVDLDKINRFLNTYNELRENLLSKINLKDFVLEVGAKTGIFDYYVNGNEKDILNNINAVENIAGIKKLIDEVHDFSNIRNDVTLIDFIDYLDIVLNDSTLDIKTDKAPNPLNAIQLSTYHSSKGKEFEHVFMPSLFNTNLEHGTAKPSIPTDYKTANSISNDEEWENYWNNQNESDRIRLIYVAFTRAKKSLNLSYYKIAGRNTKPSKYILALKELANNKEFEKCFNFNSANNCIFDIAVDEKGKEKQIPNKKNIENLKAEENNNYWQRCKKIITKRDYDYKTEFSNFINSKIDNMVYSASSLNSYLSCKRKFFYDKILKLAPKANATNSNALSFGSAIHKGFEEAVKSSKEQNVHPDINFVIDKFKQELNLYPCSSYNERQFLIERGIKTIEKYYHHITDVPADNFYSVEKEFRFSMADNNFIGYIDRIDKNSDGTYSIYDYKTGNPKSKNQVCPNGDHEDYYNQLAFYKYVFEHLDEDNGILKDEKVKNVVSTTLIFPETPEKPLDVNITDNDCIEVKNKYINAIREIKKHNFEPIAIRNSGNQPCLFCPYKDYCGLDVV